MQIEEIYIARIYIGLALGQLDGDFLHVTPFQLHDAHPQCPSET